MVLHQAIIFFNEFSTSHNLFIYTGVTFIFLTKLDTDLQEAGCRYHRVKPQFGYPSSFF